MESKIVIVLPAFNAARTLERTLAEIPPEYKNHIVLVDDASQDNTVALAKSMGLIALKLDADIVVMLHPDHQYDATMIPHLTRPLCNNESDAVFGSRMLGGRPLEGGMPFWKYFANVFLTAIANIVFRRYLTEIHSGFRAYTRKYLETVRLDENSNDFIFDAEIIAQGMANDLTFQEVPIVTRYFPEASSINFGRSVIYGFGILGVLFKYWLHKTGLVHFKQFKPKGTQQIKPI
jgi:glycosyltransferase involved in cell wall biosynthesis